MEIILLDKYQILVDNTDLRTMNQFVRQFDAMIRSIPQNLLTSHGVWAQ